MCKLFSVSAGVLAKSEAPLIIKELDEGVSMTPQRRSYKTCHRLSYALILCQYQIQLSLFFDVCKHLLSPPKCNYTEADGHRVEMLFHIK